MAFTPFLSSTYVDPELVTSANLYSRVLANINALGGFLYGEADGASTDTVTMATVATDYLVPNAAVTFTLSQQRRVRIVVAARVTSATAAGRYNAYATYVSGGSATLTGAVKLGQAQASQIATAGTGDANAATPRAEHTVLLAAGTWTAFPVTRKESGFGGGATDVAELGYCAVYDAGAS